jgi:hypothetical protein
MRMSSIPGHITAELQAQNSYLTLNVISQLHLLVQVKVECIHSVRSKQIQSEPFKTDLIISFQLSTFLLTCIVLVKKLLLLNQWGWGMSLQMETRLCKCVQASTV